MLSFSPDAGALLAVLLASVPFAGAIVVAALRRTRAAAGVAMGSALLTLVLAGLLLIGVRTPLIVWNEWTGLAGVGVGLQVDSLTVLFAALISAVSFLALLYSQRYIRHEMEGGKIASSEAAYYGYMLLFTGSMLGMVLSSDLIQLYVFWELTGIASFLLIGLNWIEEKSRRGAVKALLVTASGGVAMLVGFVLLGTIAGTFSLEAVIGQASYLLGLPLLGIALVLVVIGAAAKSAQFPFHEWLPDAMVAPSPVSAFLHSAALVAAGVYVLARLHPVFVGLELWGWVVTGVGTLSMLIGGIRALGATEFKQLLAYSTISQYGFIFALLGYGGEGAAAAAMFSFLNHGLIKAGLFLCAGTVTYATGVTALGAVGGLWKRLPGLFAVTVILALSLGGVPALAGFWMKEAFIAETLGTHSLFLVVLAVLGGALTLTYMLRFILGAFVEGREVGHVHAVPWSMFIVPGLLALLTVVYGLLPRLVEVTLVEPAAAAMIGRPVDLKLGLHLDLKLLLSAMALGSGVAMFALRDRWSGRARRLSTRMSINGLYEGTEGWLSRVGGWTLRLQGGRLSDYVYVVLFGLFVMVLASTGPVIPRAVQLAVEGGGFTPYPETVDLAMVVVLVMIGVGTMLTFILPRHVHVILALSAVGYLIAGFFALEYAPDVGLVQVHVETLVTVLFVIALVLIPAEMREKMVMGVRRRLSVLNVMLAGLIGGGSALFSWLAIENSPPNPLGPWFNDNAYELTHAADVVAAILVDFRALDTLGEITVFAIATVGVFALVQLARRENP